MEHIFLSSFAKVLMNVTVLLSSDLREQSCSHCLLSQRGTTVRTQAHLLGWMWGDGDREDRPWWSWYYNRLEQAGTSPAMQHLLPEAEGASQTGHTYGSSSLG